MISSFSSSRLLLIILFFFLLSILSCRQGHDNETLLIPYGYRGYFYVIYDDFISGEQQKYTEIEAEQRIFPKIPRRLHIIPESGILRTQFPPNPGGFQGGDKLYFYYSPQKGRKELLGSHYFDYKTELEKAQKGEINKLNEIVVFSLGYLSSNRMMTSNKETVYSTYLVDTLKNFPRWSRKSIEEEIERIRATIK